MNAHAGGFGKQDVQEAGALRRLMTLYFVTPQIANIIWALATAGTGSYAVFESARVDIEKRDVERLNPVDMANIAWAYATVSTHTTKSIMHADHGRA